jgi:hypothetical protein
VGDAQWPFAVRGLQTGLLTDRALIPALAFLALADHNGADLLSYRPDFEKNIEKRVGACRRARFK